jgi:multidrug efflux pump subunit AcrA (membrane-fusion protein)
MQERLFRKSALEKLSSPEQLDQLMYVTTPKGWLAAGALGVFMAILLLWGIFGSIPTTIPAQGVIIRGAGIRTLQASTNGQISGLLVKVGEVVAPDQPVAKLHSPDGKDITVTSPTSARILDVRVNEGDFVQYGQPLFSLENPNDDLQVVLYLPIADSKRLTPGMTVQISPAGIPKEHYGVLIGKVNTIGDFPVTTQSMVRVLGSEELAAAIPHDTASVEIDVTLDKSADGYQWTSPAGSGIALQSGTFCNATIVLADQHPISLVFRN